MQGIMKLYNVGQDTKFELGGDKETSYMRVAPAHGPSLPSRLVSRLRSFASPA